MISGNPTVCFYNDGEFYTLSIDPRLGVLRKEHVSRPLMYKRLEL